MVSSNRGTLCKPLLSGRPCAGFRVVFAVGTRPLHDGSSRGWDLPRWTTHFPRWTTHFAASAVHPITRDSPAHVPAGTSVGRSRVNALRQDWPQAAPPAVRSKSWPDRSMACITALVQNCYPGLGQRHGGAYRATPSFSG